MPVPEATFGACLRRIREERKISLRELARAVHITPTYLSDLERGNSRPPDKALLEEIIHALGIDGDDALVQSLLDLAAQGRNDLPADIKECLMHNRPLQQLIRQMQRQPNPEQLCAQLLHELS